MPKQPLFEPEMIHALGVRVRNFRLTNLLTVKELAEKMGVSMWTVNSLQAGRFSSMGTVRAFLAVEEEYRGLSRVEKRIRLEKRQISSRKKGDEEIWPSTV